MQQLQKEEVDQLFRQGVYTELSEQKKWITDVQSMYT